MALDSTNSSTRWQTKSVLGVLRKKRYRATGPIITEIHRHALGSCWWRWMHCPRPPPRRAAGHRALLVRTRTPQTRDPRRQEGSPPTGQLEHRSPLRESRLSPRLLPRLLRRLGKMGRCCAEDAQCSSRLAPPPRLLHACRCHLSQPPRGSKDAVSNKTPRGIRFEAPEGRRHRFIRDGNTRVGASAEMACVIKTHTPPRIKTD